jgi:hypothetical protein
VLLIHSTGFSSYSNTWDLRFFSCQKILNYIKSIELVDKYIKVFTIEDFISKYLVSSVFQEKQNGAAITVRPTMRFTSGKHTGLPLRAHYCRV